MVGKELIERRPSRSLNKALEELVIRLKEGNKKDKKEDGPQTAEMKWARVSGSASTSECWPICSWHPGWRASPGLPAAKWDQTSPRGKNFQGSFAFLHEESNSSLWPSSYCETWPWCLPAVYPSLSTNLIFLAKFTEVVLCVMLDNAVTVVYVEMPIP